jgi:hypothetical protein
MKENKGVYSVFGLLNLAKNRENLVQDASG